jgi:hypothetical protein
VRWGHDEPVIFTFDARWHCSNSIALIIRTNRPATINSPTWHALRLTACPAKRNANTHRADSTIHVAAAAAVIDAIAVANVEATLGAIPPDRVLDEPGKGLWKRRIELPRVDPVGHSLNNVSTAAGPVAGRAIRVVRVEPGQDAGPVHQVVHQRVDRDASIGRSAKWTSACAPGSTVDAEALSVMLTSEWNKAECHRLSGCRYGWKHERKILEKIRSLLPISSEHRHNKPLAFVCGGVAIRACAH